MDGVVKGGREDDPEPPSQKRLVEDRLLTPKKCKSKKG